MNGHVTMVALGQRSLTLRMRSYRALRKQDLKMTEGKV